jgi:dimethylaniline monooxygenase (N-oxide forming)
MNASQSPLRRRRVAVVGAGPSGLVTAKYLLAETNKLEITVLESSSQIGGTFTNKVYDNTRLVSSKYLTAFSDHRMPEDYPNHPNAEQYVEYLESYAEQFQIFPYIRFQCRVISISDNKKTDILAEKEDSPGYIVTYRDFRNNDPEGKLISQHFDWVAVCSGLHNVPNIPALPNQSAFKGDIIHSSLYKDPSIFSNKRVLVCGAGETAMDIAYRAVQNHDSLSVAMNVRRGFLSIPHTLPNDRPLDVFITNWLEHSHEHPWVNALRLRWWLSTFVIRFFLFLSGSSVGFNQWACHTKPIRRGYHIINKSHSAMSHLNVPIKKKSGLWGRFWLWLYEEENLKPIESFHQTDISSIDKNGVTVRFRDGRAFDADIIILATGYRQLFSFLDEAIQKQFKAEEKRQDNGRFRIEEDPLPSEHFIVSPSRPHLAFIGFVRPNVGAIPPMSELQIMWWLCKLRGRLDQPFLDKKHNIPSYMVLSHKYQYGVDYGNYMHRIAEEIGSAPTLSLLFNSAKPIRSLYTYCQGQAYVGLFRLRGPYVSKVCWNVFNGELFSVCMDRGWFENIGLTVITIITLGINLMACIAECGWSILTLQAPKFFCRYP